MYYSPFDGQEWDGVDVVRLPLTVGHCGERCTFGWVSNRTECTHPVKEGPTAILQATLGGRYKDYVIGKCKRVNHLAVQHIAGVNSTGSGQWSIHQRVKKDW